MSSCSRSADVLPYLMDELEDDERALFERHLEGCPVCSHELQLERALQNGLSECTLPDAAPIELRPRVLSGILTVRRPRFPYWQIGAIVAAGAAAFVAIYHVVSGTGIPQRGLGVLAGAVNAVASLLSGAGSVPLMIGTGIVIVGIASVVASIVPEE